MALYCARAIRILAVQYGASDSLIAPATPFFTYDSFSALGEKSVIVPKTSKVLQYVSVIANLPFFNLLHLALLGSIITGIMKNAKLQLSKSAYYGTFSAPVQYY